jgi:hypothetical protein
MNLSTFVSKHTLSALFVLLLIVLYVDPSIIKSLNQNVLGRIVILLVVVFFAANDTTAGLLVVLVIISIMQMYYIKEGFNPGSSRSKKSSSKPSSTSTSSDSTSSTDTVNVTTDDANTTDSANATDDANTADKGSSTGATGDQIAELKQKIQAQIQAKMAGSDTGSSPGTSGGSAKKPNSTSSADVESFFGMGDLLSVDPTRKKKSSKELNNTYQPNTEAEAEAAPSSERLFGSSLTFAPF